MRIVIADDSLLLREGLERIVTAEDITVVGAAADADEARTMVAQLAPDLLVLDVRMPPSYTTEGLDLAAELRTATEPTPIMLLSQHVHVGGALGLFDHDAAGLGYLLKDRVLDVDEFVLALRQVAAGGSVIDPLVVRALVSRRDPELFLNDLSPRELEVLELMATGLSNAAIARSMTVSIRTVETHVNNVFLKLRIPATEDDNRRVRAVVTYLAPSPQAGRP
jgi:DNA-binding NarL/FixJ family response regulator